MKSIVGRENALKTVGTIVAFHEGSSNYSDINESSLTKSGPSIEIEFTDFEGAASVGYALQTKEHGPKTMKVSQEVEIEYWDVSDEKKQLMGAGVSIVSTVMGGMLKLAGLKNVAGRVEEMAKAEDGRKHYQIAIV